VREGEWRDGKRREERGGRRGVGKEGKNMLPHSKQAVATYACHLHVVTFSHR